MISIARDVVKNAAYFLAWTGFSTIAHSASAVLVQDTRNSKDCILLAVVVLAFSQYLFSALFPVSIKCVGPPATGFSWTLVAIASTCNGIAIYTTLMSFVFSSPSTTLALKTTEPLMAGVLKAVLCSQPLTLVNFSGLPLTIFTVTIYVLIEQPPSIQVCLIPLLSNVAFACRNTMLKHADVKQKEFLFFSVNLWSAVAAAVGIYFLRDAGSMTSLITTHSVWLVLISGIATGIYALISTQVILRRFSVVLHSSLNSVKRIMVTFFVFLFWSYSKIHLLHIIIASIPVVISLTLLYRSNRLKSTQDNGMLKTEEKLDLTKSTWLTVWLIIPTLLLTMTSCSTTSLHEQTLTTVSHTQIETTQWPTQNITTIGDEQYSRSVDYSAAKTNQTFTVQLESHLRLARNLIDKPHLVNDYQRDLFGNVSKVLHGKKFTILMNTQCAYFGNRGDFALNYGTVLLLDHFKVKVVASCCAMECGRLINDTMVILESTTGLTRENFVFIYVGGGNFGNVYGITLTNFIEFLRKYPSYDYIVFPQSPFYNSKESSANDVKMFEPYNDRITFLARDNLSYDRMVNQYNFTFNNTLLTIDTAFAFGLQKLEYLPYVDFLLFLRSDFESTIHHFNSTDHDEFTFLRGDWIHPTKEKINETDMPTVLTTYDELVAETFWFISRGCVMITDRLHGHIIASISQKPHVILDNSYGKVGGFYRTWTSDLPYVKYASNIDEAFKMAVLLWRKYPCEIMASNATVLKL